MLVAFIIIETRLITKYFTVVTLCDLNLGTNVLISNHRKGGNKLSLRANAERLD
ncbi:hypothetical protein EVB99_001 [Rhizobium phage RHph_N3_19]|nr:hypothetical protein EVB99_001 [Rhizobium phage RHph_N3_19]